MKLYTRCASCKEEIAFTLDVNDRVELEMRKGKEFPKTCASCHKKHAYHVNDFTATRSSVQKLFPIILAVILIAAISLTEIFVTSLGIFFYGGIFLVPSIAFIIIFKQQQTQLNSFNRYKVKA
jgi:hypothetical protein